MGASRPAAFAADARFDEVHLRGKVHFDIDTPLDPDPMLTFLRDKRGLNLEPPLTASVDQPVAMVVAQIAGAAVLALHGEGSYTLPLAQGRGALTVGVEGDSFLLGVPLESYAGVARVSKADAAREISAACRELLAVLREHETLRDWPLLAFLQREARILEAYGAAPRRDAASEAAAAIPTWDPTEFVLDASSSLAAAAGRVEQEGAHVIPYWRATRGPGENQVSFEPIKSQGKAGPRGALARFLLPGSESALQLHIEGDEEGTARVRSRLARPSPFAAEFSKDGLKRLIEPAGALPMA